MTNKPSTILLLTSDEEFRRCVVRGFRDDDLRVLTPNAKKAATLDVGIDTVIVLDCRQVESADVYLAQLRVMATGRCRCIAIAGAGDVAKVRALTFEQCEVVDVIIPATESVADVIRAHVNDPTRSQAAAVTLELLLRLMPAPTHHICKTVVGSGFRVGTVKRLAARERCDPSGAGKKLKADSNWTQLDVIELAKASYAAILIADADVSASAATEAIGYAKESSLHGLLERVFATSVDELADVARRSALHEWLEQQIAAAVTSHAVDLN